MIDNHSDNTVTTAPPDVIFLPDWRGGNPYQDLLAAGIESSGLRVAFSDYPDSELPLLTITRSYPSVRVIHLHWINNYLRRIFWSGNSLKTRLRIGLLLFDVLMVRLRGVKVIWTVHNRLSHESPNPQREIMGRRALARAVTRLIFHSAEARTEVEQLLSLRPTHRSSIIPHGHYIGMYPPNPSRADTLKTRFNIQEADRVILFFGAIRRYKGVNSLIQALREISDPRLKLIIAGNPMDQELADEIQTAAKTDERIKPYLGFVPEEDVHPLYAIAHLAAVPFERTLTSGSAILALSMGKALLLPDEARVLGLPSGGTLFFSQQQGLREALQRLPTWDLNAMGQTNLQAVQALNWKKIGEMTVAAYDLSPSSQGRQA